MQTNKPFFTMLIFTILFLLLSVNPSFSQFLVTSTSPNHGATGVDTATTFSITFNSCANAKRSSSI